MLPEGLWYCTALSNTCDCIEFQPEFEEGGEGGF
jgi:hypothetical protein